jgi:hypothetical protein
MSKLTESRRVNYVKGARARKNFEETMMKLFRAPKPIKPEKQAKKRAASAEKKN